MATLTLALGVPSGDQTMDADLTDVRRIDLPVGMGKIRIHSDSPWYAFYSAAALADGDTPAAPTESRQKFAAGTVDLLIDDIPSAGPGQLSAVTPFYLQPTVTSQPFWATALPR